MENKSVTLAYESYPTADALSVEDRALLQEAKAAIAKAHAPYSGFRVGVAIRLINREVISGANQENASYPAGICAERVVLSTVSSLYPEIPIESMAISYDAGNGKNDHPISPCGICRQTLAEYEQRLNHPIRLILGARQGEVYILQSATDLLPLGFSAHDMGV